MHSYRTLFSICLFTLALTVNADESLAMITQHSSTVDNLSLDNIKRVFLRKSRVDNKGNPWIPVNLPVSHELRLGLSLVLFKKRPQDQEDYWNEQYFQGIDPPDVLASEEAVLRFVAMTPGAIGYVRKNSVDARVKIVSVISIPVQH